MHASAEPLFGLPKGDALRGNLVLSFAFAAYFWIVYGGSNFLAANSARSHVALPLDLMIPFVPWTVIIYLTITPLLCLAPFILRTPQRLLPLFVTLMVEVTIAGVVFCLFPVELSFPDQPVTAAEGFLLWLAECAALQYNCVPSLHVALAITAGWAYLQVGGPLWRGFICCWIVAIILSTLLGHQHHLVDLAAGFLLAAIAVVTVPPLVRRWQWRELRPRALTPPAAECEKTT
jgi:membrane-associated phospholipid phosphatase